MTIRVFTALAVLALCLPACGSKNKPAVKDPTSARIDSGKGQSDDSGGAEKTEPAQGELRDVLITLRRVHFPFDSNELTEDARAALAEAGPKLARYPDVHLYVDGHADQRGTEEYNVALGERRAQVVADYLMRMGVTKDQLHIVSFGEGRPLIEQDTDVAMAKNRRVDFRLMRGEVRLVVEEGPLVDDKGRPIENGATAQSAPEPNE
ncbi:MAG TPA: OmpA family protein [Haliangium sp.]|nr:OmpA family protein [Haliangium sp.]